MKKIIFLFAAAAIFAQIGLSAAPLTEKLPSGATLVFEENHSAPLVAVDVWFASGSAYDSPLPAGTAHLAEHCAFNMTKNRPAGRIDWDAECLGTTLDAHTSRDWIHYSCTVPSRYIEKALDILSDAVINPVYDEGETDIEKRIVADELARKSMTPFSVMKDFLAADLYESNPYGRPIEGYPDTVSKITREDLLKFRSTHLTASRCAVVLVGDITKEKAAELASKYFTLEKGEPTPPIPEPKTPEYSERVVNIPYLLTYTGFGFMGPKAADFDEVCAVDVLMTCLVRGGMGLIDRAVKGECLSDFLTSKGRGMITIGFSCKEEDVAANEDALLKVIEDIKAGVDPAITEAAKRYLLGTCAFDNETVGGRASALGFYFTLGEASLADKYIDGVRAVTPERVSAAAKKYLDKAHAKKVVFTAKKEAGK